MIEFGKYVTAKRARVAALTLVSAATVWAVPWIKQNEGESLKAYLDSAKVWTICHGETLNVKPTDVRTKEWCDKNTQARTYQFTLNVAKLITTPLYEDVGVYLLGSHSHFAYNVGITGYSKSQVLKLTNKGDLIGGCYAMLNWYKAGGVDCRVRSSNCYGLWVRRQNEVKECLKGAR